MRNLSPSTALRTPALRRAMTLAALAAALGCAAVPLTGCYGKFALTRKLHQWNGSVTGNRFANSAILWVLLIVPVYELAGLADFVFLNTVEVLTGRNPMAAACEVRELHRNGHHYVLRAVGPDEVEVSVDGRPALRYHVEGEDIVLTTPDGEGRGRVPVADALRAAQAPDGGSHLVLATAG